MTRVLRLFAALLVIATLPSASSAQDTGADSAPSDASEVGYLKVDVGPRIDSLYVVINRKFDNPLYIENGDSLTLPAGEQYVTLVMRRTRDISFSETIEAGKTSGFQTPLDPEKSREAYLEKSSYPVLHNDVNLVVVTDRDSRVFIDKEPWGMGIARVDVSEGRHLIETVHPKAGRTTRLVNVQRKPPRLERAVMYNKPSRSKVQSRSVLPGLAQLHKGQKIKGLSFLAGFGGLVVGTVQQHFAFKARNREYEDLREKYRTADKEEIALRLGNEAERLSNSARGAYLRRNILLGATAGIYLYSLFDAWLDRPRGGYRTPVSRQTRVEPLLGIRESGVRFVIHF